MRTWRNACRSTILCAKEAVIKTQSGDPIYHLVGLARSLRFFLKVKAFNVIAWPKDVYERTGRRIYEINETRSIGRSLARLLLRGVSAVLGSIWDQELDVHGSATGKTARSLDAMSKIVPGPYIQDEQDEATKRYSNHCKVRFRTLRILRNIFKESQEIFRRQGKVPRSSKTLAKIRTGLSAVIQECEKCTGSCAMRSLPLFTPLARSE